MSERIGDVWWAPGSPERGRMVPGPGPTGEQPELVDATQEAVRAAVRDRVPGYTPDWTDPDRQDAGVALVRLFGTQTEPVLARVNRLPEKILAEHLSTAGVRRRPATVATALLEFTVNRADGASVLLAAGVQTSASTPDGQVIYETDHDLYATPATLRTIATARAGTLETVPPGRPFPPFGRDPQPGSALWLGLAGTANPYPCLSLGFVIDAPAPAPVTSGGTTTLPLPPAPLLRWDVLDGGRFVPAEVMRDDTGGLRRTGTVQLRLPPAWAPAARSGPPLRWLRVLVVQGTFATAPPLVSGLRLNMVSATAARTVLDEPPEPLHDPADPATGRRFRLSQVPILAGSLVIDVDDPAADLFGTAAGSDQPWREVESLAGYGPDDRVFVVDHATGVLTFGDGVNGVAVPPGFRTVRAERYRVGGGTAGAVPAGAITTVVTALPSVTGVSNPFPATGGSDAEPDGDVMRRGVAELRSRGRAVAPADYGLLALRAPGASVARAHGVPGLHPELRGRPLPGVVGVLVVPPADDSGQPPVPTSETLRAVADHLTGEVAPAGITVVTGPVRFQRIAVEARLTLDPGQDRAGVLARAADAVTTYLDPIVGGENGAGWPFGGAVRHAPLVRRLLSVDGVRAVSGLSLTVDGRRLPACTDHAIPRDDLVWPERPLLIPAGEGARP
ncbi:putative baseplate assembly protein [Paractinoplanes atraurantiacus]|uniref:Putative baseplate assembly protein n=1 Tax=Paractinoplanes atraurantiacus TaxID=1036182 RepID=A0A285HQ52_9ACTN|nr:putative baseplate assembly protein [Actinoplanes atraurantiacus]SNY37848.1 putative baseplate assembly protein [Actinoplanes atraurantiacus]